MNEILNVRNQTERHANIEMAKHVKAIKEMLWEAIGEEREELLEELVYLETRNK